MSAARGSAQSTRTALRNAIHDDHEALHGIPVLRRLADGTITIDDYVALLEKFLLFHGAMERGLAAGPSLADYGIDLQSRAKVPLLVADLRALGQSNVSTQGKSIGDFPAPTSKPAALGMLYVIEGATLGGRILAKSLDHLLGTAPDGRRFLLGHAADHAAMWQALCHALERGGEQPGDRAVMIASARRALAWFEAIMTGGALGEVR